MIGNEAGCQQFPTVQHSRIHLCNNISGYFDTSISSVLSTRAALVTTGLTYNGCEAVPVQLQHSVHFFIVVACETGVNDRTRMCISFIAMPVLGRASGILPQDDIGSSPPVHW